MFRRYPYWGWLLLSLALWCINGYDFHMHHRAMQPEHLAQTVNKDLQDRQNTFGHFIKEEHLLRRMFSDSMTEKESGMVNSFPFYIFGYDNDTLKFWNTNTLVVGYNDSAVEKAVVVHTEQGVFVERCVRLSLPGGRKKLVVLFPVLITYPLENDYLHSHFAASDNIPVKTKILTGDRPFKGAYPVTMAGDAPVFYLFFNAQEIQKWVPDLTFIALLIASLLASIWWVQLMVIHLTERTSPFAGFMITLAIITVIRLLLFVYGLPFNIDGLTLFDPGLYASNKFLSSLGDLFIDTLCFLWIVVFVIRHTPYRTYFNAFKNKPLRALVAVGLIFLLIGFVFLFVNIIRSLVLDSNISFDVSHFYAINLYTILGLLVIGGITGISCLVVFLFNLQLKQLISNRWGKYVLVLIAGIIWITVAGAIYNPDAQLYPFDWMFDWALLGWLLLFILLLDIRNFTLVSDLFEPRMIFWAIFICAFCTSVLQYFNQKKEKETRIAFVKRQISPNRDYELESPFYKTGNNIERDKGLKTFFYKPTAALRKILDQRFYAQYLKGAALNKYRPTVYLFDARKRSLNNADSTGFNTLLNEKFESEPTNSPYLFYKESFHDRHYYLAYIPVYSDSINNVIGYVIIDLDSKKQLTETVSLELLQPTTNKANTHDNEYAYAVYVKGKLSTQTNGYPYTTYLRNDTLTQEYKFFTNNNISELYYKIAADRIAVVIHYHSLAIDMITLFSYLFVIQVLLAVMIMMYQLYLTYFTGKSSGKLIKFTLRRRVHFSMLAVVLVSFIIIGFVTIFFFTNQYRSSNADKLQSKMQVANQSVQSFIKREDGYKSDSLFISTVRSARFKEFITSLANGQKIDINIFDDEGELLNTSQDDIYNKGLIAHIIRPDAFYQLDGEGKSVVIQNEQIAGLSYLSAYESLRDERGATLGYINVPFFSSEKDLNFQISNIVVTLINLYAFIFLFSSVITIFITRWITNSFTIIIRQFGRLNLQQNERITWPYDDEIGLLVREYNKMVNKVEENAALLAQSERESAWREMARQVAHEIKNPLTPMKLNIQYLQQAIRNDSPNIKELTNKVSDSIVEQIDNLSYIASEFSNFAKMPEARPEDLELGALLNKAVELYLDDAHIKVTINDLPEKLYVFADRSQLLRVITNLLENAKQAIPSDRMGNIEVFLRAENNDAIITVTDNGEGIPEDVTKKIFQPYFTTKTSGTGLGLAMTKKILEFWKGEIWFETVPGEGTTFFIRLPLTVKS